jgi:PmbA protein
MEKEYLLNKSNEITLNITDGKIDSYREKDETQSTVRVYENGTIGVAGALGDPDFDALEKEAAAKLGGIPYPCKLNEGVKKSIIRNKPVVAEKDIMRVSKRLAKKVAANGPFVYSRDINLDFEVEPGKRYEIFMAQASFLNDMTKGKYAIREVDVIDSGN